MYYATKRNNTQTRLIGIAGVAISLAGAGYGIANGLGLIENKAPVESEVVIIEEVEEVKDEPPPPPPVDVDLPPPPPQVILPDFVFDTPPPQENAVQQVISTPTPRPAAAAPVRPPPPPAATIRTQPNTKSRRFKEPEYPSASRRAGEEGETRLSICVDAEGRTSNAKLIRSSGSTRLDEAAIKSMNNNRVDPAIGTDGKPIAMCNPPWEITWVWRLENAR